MNTVVNYFGLVLSTVSVFFMIITAYLFIKGEIEI